MKKTMYDLHPEARVYWVDPDIIVTVVIDFFGDINELKVIGFEVHTTSVNIFAGGLNFPTWSNWFSIPELFRSIKRACSTRLHLSVPDIMALTLKRS